MTNSADHLERLIGDHLDGVLDQQGEQELTTLLTNSKEARKLLAAHMRMHGAMCVLGKAGVIKHITGEDRERAAKSLFKPRVRFVQMLTGLAAGFVIVALVWLTFIGEVFNQAPLAVVSDVRDAKLRSGDKETKLTKETAIKSGDSVYTTDHAIITFRDGTVVVMDEQSEATFLDSSDGKRVQLHTGLLKLDVAPQQKGQSFIVKTSKADVIVVGTKFIIEASPDYTDVEVREGVVRVAAQSQQGVTTTVETKAGEIARVNAQGNITSSMQTPTSGDKLSDDTIVYWTNNKKRVHVVGCTRLTNDENELKKIPKMTLAEALKKGLPLCSRCPGSTTPGVGTQKK